MTPRFPDDTVDGFPAPPREITDKKGRPIEVRRADGSDIDALTEMYLEFDPEDRAQGIPPSDEDSIREWLETVTSEDTFNVIATYESRPVGHVMLVGDGESAYELAIFVLQPYQGAHIGTELVRTILGLAERRGIEQVWLTVERWNTPAIALYQKIGFETTDSASFEMEMALRLDVEPE